jgi:hypothetical protein
MSGWFVGWRRRLPGGFWIGWRKRLGGSRRRQAGLGCGGLLLLACCASVCIVTFFLGAASPKPGLPAAVTALAATATTAPSATRPAPTNTRPPTATRTEPPVPTNTMAPLATATSAPPLPNTQTPVLTEPLPTQAPTVGATDTAAPQSSPLASGGYVCAGGSACIKGNISSGGRKFYHFPGCPSYNSTKIDTSKGERWFVTAAEAEAAGWVKAGNCP